MAQPIKRTVVFEVVAEWFDISIKDLLGPRKTKIFVNARQIAMHILRKHTRLSLPAIGAAFNRDHTTVIHAIQRVDHLLTTAGWQADYAEIERAVMERSFPETQDAHRIVPAHRKSTSGTVRRLQGVRTGT